jgi:hypothetical protein
MKVPAALFAFSAERSSHPQAPSRNGNLQFEKSAAQVSNAVIDSAATHQTATGLVGGFRTPARQTNTPARTNKRHGMVI